MNAETIDFIMHMMHMLKSFPSHKGPQGGADLRFHSHQPDMRSASNIIIVTLNLDCVQSLRNVHSRLLVLQSGIVFRVI